MGGGYRENIAEQMLRWYDYTVTVPAGGQLINAVTAPLCPSANAEFEPPVYDYTYLLSPAKTWAAFGSLDITLRTPYYLFDSAGFDFTETEEGYALSLPSLPDGELRFSLCADPDPKFRSYGCGCDAVPFVLVFFYVAGSGIVLITVLAVWETAAERRRAERERKTKESVASAEKHSDKEQEP